MHERKDGAGKLFLRLPGFFVPPASRLSRHQHERTVGPPTKNGLFDRRQLCQIAIGVARPVSIHVETFGTGKVDNEKIVGLIEKNFDLRPAGIIAMLDLQRPIYKQTAAYGHFGRNDLNLPWEQTDKAETLRKEAGL